MSTFSRRSVPLLFTLLTALVLSLTACGGSSSSSTPATLAPPLPEPVEPQPEPEPEPEPPTDPEPVNLHWDDSYQRDVDYPATVTLPQQLITVRDGTRLAATLILPADADGNAASGPFPTIATFTGYNQFYSGSAFADPALVQRGYAYITIDMRGTGASQGTWQAFGPLDHNDIADALQYIQQQPWSNGDIGLNGASYMGITGLLAGAQGDPAVKAIFAIVPMGDAYRDIVFSGGQINLGFIPLWMTLVTGLGVVPTPAGFDNRTPGYTLGTLLEHLQGALTDFQVPVIASALLGGDRAYDDPFWRVRSPLEHADNISAPTFIVGGLKDIFQRGEPLLYEALKGHTTAKLLLGPWEHLDGSAGAGLPRDGVPDLGRIRLAWFDHYLKQLDSGAEQFPPVTQYYLGAERYHTAADWPHPQAEVRTFYLHGRELLPLFGSLSSEAPTKKHSTALLQTPLNGLCSASASQWTAGLLGILLSPCSAQNNAVELFEAVYTSAPLEQDLIINGPIAGQIWASTTGFDTNVVVRVSAVDAKGLSRPLTQGIQMASMSANDSTRARYLDGELIQPWHPFTRDSGQPVRPFTPFQADVEVFPTSAVIRAGEKLRISVGPSDFPRLSPIPDLLTSLLGLMTVYSEPERASRVNIPVLPLAALPAS